MKKRYLRLVRQALRALRIRHLRKLEWWQRARRSIRRRELWIPCRDSVATGVAIGLFFSMMLMPFQMVPTALLSMKRGGNVPFAMASCWVSNPLTLPAILLSQIKLGQWLMAVFTIPLPDPVRNISFQAPGLGSVNAATFILGMFCSGLLLSLAAFPLVHLLSALMPQHLPVRRRKGNRSVRETMSSSRA